MVLIMEIINTYFSTLVFSRIEEKQGYVIYGACIGSMLGGGSQRYVLAFVPSHLAIKTQARLKELSWENLQTRTLRNSYRMQKQSYRMQRGLPDVLLQVVKRDDKYSTYSGPEHFPFEVLMIHDPRKKTKYQYNNKLMLSSAIESFNAIFNYTGDEPSINYTSSSNSDNTYELIPPSD